MSEEVYQELRAFLDTMAGGFPTTKTGVEMRLLKKLFTPQDASLALKLSLEPESVEAIAERAGLGVAETAERLASMAQRGIIFRKREGGHDLYRAEQFVVGIYEYQNTSIDKEFAELFDEYMPYLGLRMMSTDTQQMRVVPVGSAIETVVPSVATYDRVRDLVAKKETICLSPCVCRIQNELLGNECTRRFDGCLGFGDFAEFMLSRGYGKRISSQEALEVLDRSEEAGMVLQPNNAQDVEYVCSCCSCCCGVLKRIKLFPNPAALVESHYQVRRDADECTACGICVERCPMDAMEEAGDVIEINLERCIGCGVCVPTCPQEALSMHHKPGVRVPEADEAATRRKILEERAIQLGTVPE